MSLNHILNGVVPDEEKLDVKFGNIYYDNLIPAPAPGPSPVMDYTNLELRLYEQMGNVIISGITGDEQSLFYVNPNSIGTNIIPANSVRNGSKYRVYARGNIATNGSNQVFTFKTKLGSAILATDLISLTNLTQGSKWTITGEILVVQDGTNNIAIADTFLKFEFADTQGNEEVKYIQTLNQTTFQTIIDDPLDMTIAWDPAQGGQNNQLYCSALSFSRIY